MLGDFLATMSIYIPYTYIPHMAMAKGVKVTTPDEDILTVTPPQPENAAFLISASGISSTMGRWGWKMASSMSHHL